MCMYESYAAGRCGVWRMCVPSCLQLVAVHRLLPLCCFSERPRMPCLALGCLHSGPAKQYTGRAPDRPDDQIDRLTRRYSVPRQGPDTHQAASHLLLHRPGLDKSQSPGLPKHVATGAKQYTHGSAQGLRGAH